MEKEVETIGAIFIGRFLCPNVSEKSGGFRVKHGSIFSCRFVFWEYLLPGFLSAGRIAFSNNET